MKQKLTKSQIVFYVMSGISVALAIVIGGLCIFYSHLFEGFLSCTAAIVIVGVLVLMYRLDKDRLNNMNTIDLGGAEAIFAGVDCFKEGHEEDKRSVVLSIHEKGIHVDCGDAKDDTYYRHIIWSDILLMGGDKVQSLSVGLVGDGVLVFEFPSILKYKSAYEYLLRHDLREV